MAVSEDFKTFAARLPREGRLRYLRETEELAAGVRRNAAAAEERARRDRRLAEELDAEGAHIRALLEQEQTGGG